MGNSTYIVKTSPNADKRQFSFRVLGLLYIVVFVHRTLFCQWHPYPTFEPILFRAHSPPYLATLANKNFQVITQREAHGCKID